MNIDRLSIMKKMNIVALSMAGLAVLLVLLLLFVSNKKAKFFNSERFEASELGVDASYPKAVSNAEMVPTNPNLASSGFGTLGGSDPLGNEMYNPVSGGGSPPSAGTASCFPRDRLSAEDLLPKDAANSKWAQMNPAGQGDVRDQNFLTAGYHVGVNTQGSSMRNANLQLRSEPPNPQVPVSIFNNSTITPDVLRKDLEIS